MVLRLAVVAVASRAVDANDGADGLLADGARRTTELLLLCTLIAETPVAAWD